MTRGVKIREREWATEGYAGLFVTLPVGVAGLGQLTAAVGGIVGQLGIGGDDDVGRRNAMLAPSGGDILLFHCGGCCLIGRQRMAATGMLRAAKLGCDTNKRGRGSLFYENLLGGAIVEDEDVQALLEGGVAMAGGRVDEGVREVKRG